MLDAVVVTGYQTVERRKLTAAVSKLDISDETIGAVKSIVRHLPDKLPDFLSARLQVLRVLRQRYAFAVPLR